MRRDRVQFLRKRCLGIMNQDYVSILRLLIMLAHKYHCPFHLPSHVDVVVVHREVRGQLLRH